MGILQQKYGTKFIRNKSTNNVLFSDHLNFQAYFELLFGDFAPKIFIRKSKYFSSTGPIFNDFGP